jgi:hypothetical protein
MINKIQNINESNKKYLIRCYELLCKVHFQRHQYQSRTLEIGKNEYISSHKNQILKPIEKKQS